MNKPLVSFLIPYYNHKQYVKKTLDSIYEDSYSNKEIIIINDGSTDPDDSSINLWIEHHHEDILINYVKRKNKFI